MSNLILCDFFGVFVTDYGEKFMTMIGIPNEKDKFFVPADRGDISMEDLLNNISKETGMSAKEIQDTWNKLQILNQDVVTQMRELHKSNKIILVSNAPHNVVPKIIERFNINDIFDELVISGDVHIVKPDLKIFEIALKNEQTKNYDNVYMIDDNIKNLEHVHKLGITPIQYKKGMVLKTMIK